MERHQILNLELLEARRIKSALIFFFSKLLMVCVILALMLFSNTLPPQTSETREHNKKTNQTNL